ncbi:ATP-binding protein [Aliarcobacter butzleri]|uniref:ATP-binding protein n=1 Tax=Aliarcobacter butzleri TaxID=28197 RepID=UPI001EDB6B32|nr:ATP-binding protein [Aliarcobacter butzleri]MCG3661752.1 ATP-binding protein [Aliarcobacter butzleri]
MQIITGQSARKENFWKRDKEIKDIWYKIKSNQHLLLVAPRRVGKTSIMHNLLDTANNDYIVLYIDTESADSENEFWKKLFYKLIDEEFVNTLQTKATNFWRQLKNIKISEISTKGVKFADRDELEYVDAFKEIVKNLDTDKKFIIMVDEFAQTIENIIKYENVKSAQSLLKNHREIRQDKKLSERITLIYAGSIGLESVASKIDSISLINDLSVIKVSPLEFDDAKEFVKILSISNDINIEKNEIIYLLNKIEWLIPFYIQLIMDELRKSSTKITTQIIDKTFSSILSNRNHFEHWHTRLKSLEDCEYKFAKKILNITSEKQVITFSEIVNIAEENKLSVDEAKEVRNSLIYDGYINNNDNVREYRFNSPILKMWWYKNVAN